MEMDTGWHDWMMILDTIFFAGKNMLEKNAEKI